MSRTELLFRQMAVVNTEKYKHQMGVFLCPKKLELINSDTVWFR